MSLKQNVGGWSFAYKCLSETNQSINGFVTIQYSFGRIIKPEVGKLFVFNTLNNAKKYYDTKIYLCSVKNAYECARSILNIYHISTDSVKEYWKNERYDFYATLPPNGTMLCDELVLLEMVHDGTLCV